MNFRDLVLTWLVFMLLMIVILSIAKPAHSEQPAEWSSVWNDGNKATFLDSAVLVETAENGRESIYHYVWIPRVPNQKVLFCLRVRDARVAQCFYADEDSSRGDIEVRIMLPRGE